MEKLNKFAEELNGNEYGDEMSKEQITFAKENGIVVVFGYSDDNIEFEGVIHEEYPMYDGGNVWFNKEGTNFCEDDGRAGLTCHDGGRDNCLNKLECLWCKEKDYAWTYNIDVPHVSFDVMEDGEKFCRAIVFYKKDLK